MPPIEAAGAPSPGPGPAGASRVGEARLRLLTELNTATQPLIDPAEIMSATAAMLGRHLGVSRCAYAEMEADENHFAITGDYNDGVPSIVGRYAFASFGAACLAAMRADEAWIVDDAETDPRIAASDRAAYRGTCIGAVICLPLHKAGRLVAAMAVHQRTARAWRADDIELVQLVVNRCWETLERARTVRALQATADRLGLAMAASRSGDWNWHIATDAIDFSPRAAELFGIDDASRPIGRDALRQRIHPEDRQRAAEALERCLMHGERYEAEYRLHRDDGAECWLAVCGMAQHAPDGRVVGLLGVVQDVTRRKAMEQQLATRADLLALNDRRKDEFLATLAHELRNPLAPLRSALDLLEQADAPPQQRQRAQAIMSRQVGQLARLVDELIDVSRISSGKLELSREPVEAASVLGLAAEIAEPLLQSRGQRLDVAAGDGPLRLLVDATRLAQVLSNLLNNAAKYSPPGTTVRLSVSQTAGALEIAVRDEGMGIDAAFLPCVFDMFVQSPQGRDMRVGGLGIGLALSRRLVELHGGTLEARSAGAGRGSTFTVSLPASLVLPAAAPPAAIESAGGAADRLSVLVIDDNVDAADTLQMLLDALGHRAMAAYDPDRGIELATEARPDALFIDIGMPRRNGYEVAEALRGEPRVCDARLIALTGWGHDADRRRAAEAGFDLHLTKPVSIEQMVEALRGLRPRASAPAPAPAPASSSAPSA